MTTAIAIMMIAVVITIRNVVEMEHPVHKISRRGIFLLCNNLELTLLWLIQVF